MLAGDTPPKGILAGDAPPKGTLAGDNPPKAESGTIGGCCVIMLYLCQYVLVYVCAFYAPVIWVTGTTYMCMCPVK